MCFIRLKAIASDDVSSMGDVVLLMRDDEKYIRQVYVEP